MCINKHQAFNGVRHVYARVCLCVSVCVCVCIELFQHICVCRTVFACCCEKSTAVLLLYTPMYTV